MTHLLLPGIAIRLLGSDPLGRGARGVVRVLGVRQLVQALATSAQPTAAVLVLGVEVDLAHAASMVGSGMLSGRWRRVALADAAIAIMFAVAGALLARSNGQPNATFGFAAIRDRAAESLAGRLVPSHFMWALSPASQRRSRA
jgi:hypothetical protein